MLVWCFYCANLACCLTFFFKKKEKSVRAEEHAQSEKARKLERTLKKIRSVNINGSTGIEQVKKRRKIQTSTPQHHRYQNRGMGRI
jgi:hypothetical protein